MNMVYWKGPWCQLEASTDTHQHVILFPKPIDTRNMLKRLTMFNPMAYLAWQEAQLELEHFRELGQSRRTPDTRPPMKRSQIRLPPSRT